MLIFCKNVRKYIRYNQCCIMNSGVFGERVHWPVYKVRFRIARIVFRWCLVEVLIRVLKPHCIRCSHFKVDDVSALEGISKPPVRTVEDNVTASLHQQCMVMAWMLWRHNVDLQVPAGTSTRLHWTQCCFSLKSVVHFWEEINYGPVHKQITSQFDNSFWKWNWPFH
jgi:hypothetical protein